MPEPTNGQKKPIDPFSSGMADGMIYLLMANITAFLTNPVAYNNALVAIEMCRRGGRPPKLSRLPDRTGQHDWRIEFEVMSKRRSGDAKGAADAMMRAAEARGPGVKPKSDTEWSAPAQGDPNVQDRQKAEAVATTSTKAQTNQAPQQNRNASQQRHR